MNTCRVIAWIWIATFICIMLINSNNTTFRITNTLYKKFPVTLFLKHSYSVMPSFGICFASHVNNRFNEMPSDKWIWTFINVWPSCNVKWRHRNISNLFEVMACMNQRWRVLSEIQCHSRDINFTGRTKIIHVLYFVYGIESIIPQTNSHTYPWLISVMLNQN